jgi:hypothetical protein
MNSKLPEHSRILLILQANTSLKRNKEPSVKKEGKRGLTGFADLGSFGFEKIKELMQSELWCSQKSEDRMKTVCCYHLRDFEKLTETQQHTLFDHHFKSILIE